MTRAYTTLLLSMALVGGCVSTQVIKAVATPAIQAQEEIPQELLVDVGITPFDPGIPEDEQELAEDIIVPDVRRAESRYFAYHLKDTLELTGNWGAVRVTPQGSSAVDLIISGEIKVSDGEGIKADIKAVDSTGRVWIDKEYEDISSKFSYRNQRKEDPFQDFYNSIANDLLAVQQKLTATQLRTLRRVSSLRFAISLSPDAFDGYIEEDSRGKVAIKQLPAENDPMLARIDKIKQREYLFIDTLDDYYAKFYTDMQLPYHDWREYTYDEAIKLQQMEKEAKTRMLGGAAMIVGGIVAGQKSGTYAGQIGAGVAVAEGAGVVKAGFNKRKEAEIHADSLRELSASLGAEITPIVLDIEGKTIELSGTVSEQYTQWRRILKEIYAEETGLAVK
ncbi:MAG: hypothetical protein QGI68_12840 [Pseudomonadales bacterium]|nr:hypothetical protein [Pseudomonadales bacterium]MDP7596439.1 hypothetical protein [Pseudomonadales bacterium]HJN52814.1 hypothetical protein [Pseudomonadales bacterium]